VTLSSYHDSDDIDNDTDAAADDDDDAYYCSGLVLVAL